MKHETICRQKCDNRRPLTSEEYLYFAGNIQAVCPLDNCQWLLSDAYVDDNGIHRLTDDEYSKQIPVRPVILYDDLFDVGTTAEINGVRFTCIGYRGGYSYLLVNEPIGVKTFAKQSILIDRWWKGQIAVPLPAADLGMFKVDVYRNADGSFDAYFEIKDTQYPFLHKSAEEIGYELSELIRAVSLDTRR